jgi:uncharacterized protein (TIGR00106 family)
MILAELAIFPTSEGSSVSKFVKEVIGTIENSGLKSLTGSMSTVIESPDLKSLFNLIEETDKVLVDMGAKRIHVDLRIDHRLDKDATIDTKLRAVGKL